MRNDLIKISDLRIASVFYVDANDSFFDLPSVKTFTFFVNVGGKWLNAFRPFNECNVYEKTDENSTLTLRGTDFGFSLVNGRVENGLGYVLSPPLKSVYGHTDVITFDELVKGVCKDTSKFYLDKKYISRINNEFASVMDIFNMIRCDSSRRRKFSQYLKPKQRKNGEKVGIPKLRCLNEEVADFRLTDASIYFRDMSAETPYSLSCDKPLAIFTKIGDKWINVFHPLIDCNVYFRNPDCPFEYELLNGKEEQGICYVIFNKDPKCYSDELQGIGSHVAWTVNKFYVDRWDLCFVDKGFASNFDKIRTGHIDSEKQHKYIESVRTREKYSEEHTKLQEEK